MALALPPAARERRRAARTLLERVLLLLVLWRLGTTLGRGLAGEPLAHARRAVGPPPLLRIDVARDPAWRLEHLPGLGPARARAIVRERQARGPPQRLEDLLRVQGIGPGRLEAIRAARDVRVVLDGAPVAVPSVQTAR